MIDDISTYLWPGQTHFGYGAVELAGQEAAARRAAHVFLLTDPGIIAAGLLKPILASLEAAGIQATIYDRVPANPDVASVDAAGRAFYESVPNGRPERAATMVVAVGGGSVLDAAKGVRLLAGGLTEIKGAEGISVGEYALILGDEARPIPPTHTMPPMMAIPTTAGTGAEVTPWGVLTDLERKLKFGIGGAYLIPDVALIDPGMTLTLPPGLTAATGMDALSHLIEAYVSTNVNPALDPMILYGIELIGRSLPVAVAQPANRQSRYEVMLASMIGGIAISSKWLGACHSLAHQLSGFADVHHGLAIALMLPHQIAFSLPGAMERYGRVADALEAMAGDGSQAGKSRRQRAERAVTAVRQLMDDIGLPSRLRDIGVTEEMLPAMAQNAYVDLNWMTNPCLVTEADMVELYRRAF